MYRYLILLFVFLTCKLSAQPSLQLDLEKKYGSYIITPTINNTSKILLSENSAYKDAMSKCNYSISRDGITYIANTSVGTPYFTIKKEYNSLLMIFTEDSGMAKILRNELVKNTKTQPQFEGKYESFIIVTEFNGYTQKLKYFIKENPDGSSSIGVQKL